MDFYIYSNSGHNFGLENIRRCAAIYKKFNNINPILATADYRAATFAKSELGVKTGLGVDIIGNLPHLMKRRDILIFDSKEPNETMKEYMEEFCTSLYEVGVDIPYDIVDDIFFTKIENKREKCFFFADDDYENELLNFVQDSSKQDIPLLLGHYFFLGNDDKLAPYFSEIFEDEEYEEIIRTTKYLLTSSVHSALESLASGNCPVFFARKIKEFKGNVELLEKYNIPIIDGDTFEELVSKFNQIICNYPQTNQIQPANISKIIEDIETTVKKYDGLF